jgi:hypothetical protein
LGAGTTIIRNFNQENKGIPLGDWWQSDWFLLWDGKRVRRIYPLAELRKWEQPKLEQFGFEGLKRQYGGAKRSRLKVWCAAGCPSSGF